MPRDIRDLNLDLADLGVLGDPETLRRDAEAEQPAEPSSRYDGAEDTQSVWVAVDPRGRVVDVDVSRTWSERLAPERFADALFTVYQSAIRKALAAELAVARDDEPPPSAPPADDHAEPGFDEWLRRVRAEADEVSARLRAITSDSAPPPADTLEIRSPNGYLTLRLVAGGPVGIDGNTTGLTWADTDRLRQDVLDMFRDAGLAAARHDPDEDDEYLN